jgi:hypothetical protein
LSLVRRCDVMPVRGVAVQALCCCFVHCSSQSHLDVRASLHCTVSSPRTHPFTLLFLTFTRKKNRKPSSVHFSPLFFCPPPRAQSTQTHHQHVSQASLQSDLPVRGTDSKNGSPRAFITPAPQSHCTSSASPLLRLKACPLTDVRSASS